MKMIFFDNKKETFGKKLTEAMKENGITQTTLAEILKTTQATVSRWCKGLCEPSYENLVLMCGLFNESPNSLIDFDEEVEYNRINQKIVDNVANTKEFRKQSKEIIDKELRKEISFEESRAKQIELLQTICDNYCKRIGIENRKINVAYYIFD